MEKLLSKDYWKYFQNTHPSSSISSYNEAKEIVDEFHKKISHSIINKGHVFITVIGKIFVARSMRNNAKYPINWNATMQYKKELQSQGIQIRDKEHPDGKNYFIYITDESFVFWAWQNSSKSVPYLRFYCFDSTKDNRRELSNEARKPEAKMRYTKIDMKKNVNK